MDLYYKDKKINLGQGSSEGIPIGGIIIWSWSVDTIPDGWHICDGTDGTLDLRDKFVLGASSNHPAGGMGGEETHRLTIDEMPSHAHLNTFAAVSTSTKKFVPSTASNAVNSVSPTQAETIATGGSMPHNNMPPYYALYYIQKIK